MSLLKSRPMAVSSMVALLMSPPLGAAGKKAPSTPSEEPQYTQAIPYRAAYLKPVSTLPFTLPNQSRVDLSVDLYHLMQGAATSSSRFLVTPTPAVDECGNHLEVSAALTTLDLNVFGLKVKFGYNPQGEINPSSPALTGKLRVDVGLIGMDFGVWRCKGSDCAEIIATRSTHSQVDGSLTMEIDFNEITASPELLYKTPLGDTIGKIMADGMAKTLESERMSTLPWRATVREVIPTGSGSLLWFNAGQQDGLAPNQLFTIFAPTSGANCDVYRPLAVAHTTSNGTVVSHEAVVDSIDPTLGRAIQPGDVVMVRQAPVSR